MARNPLWLVACICLSACSTLLQPPSLYTASDYQTVLSEGKWVTLPAVAEAHMLSALGEKERMTDYEYYVEPKLAEQLQRSLRARGYGNDMMTRQALAEAKHYNHYAAMAEAFHDAHAALLASPTTEPLTMTLGGNAKALSDALGVRRMVYAYYTEAVNDSAAKAVGFVTDVALRSLIGGNSEYRPDISVITLAMIDGHTDRVVWLNQASYAAGSLEENASYSDEEQSARHVKYSVRNVLRALPRRSALRNDEGTE
jgi:hypothetical protein